MFKTVVRIISVNNLDVKFKYTWSKDLNAPKILGLIVLNGSVNVTRTISKKRLQKICAELAEIMHNHREVIKAELAIDTQIAV